MGMNCCLWIINYSGCKLKLNMQHCNLMKSWHFCDIDPGMKQPFSIDYGNSFIETEQSCSGLAEFILDGTEYQIQLQAILNQDSTATLQVDWKNIDQDIYAVFPPPESTKATFVNSNNVGLIIQKRLHRVHSPLFLRPAAIMDWMCYYSDVIGALTLREMTLPCSHNSGTYRPYSCIPFSPIYVRCQSQSLSSQLKQGIRVLDLRIKQNGNGNYILSHSRWKTHYTLKRALQEVVDFIDQTSKEIVILDFHGFISLRYHNFDYSTLKKQVKEYLKGYYLPMFDGALDQSLQYLWSNQPSENSRVVVAWNHEDSQEEDMIPGVYQEWYKQANSESKLYNALEKTFSTNLHHKGLWSVCVFRAVSICHSPLKNAEHLQSKIDTWFYGCADWTLKANIISTDFTCELNSNIHAIICANLLKGAKKIM